MGKTSKLILSQPIDLYKRLDRASYCLTHMRTEARQIFLGFRTVGPTVHSETPKRTNMSVKRGTQCQKVLFTNYLPLSPIVQLFSKAEYTAHRLLGQLDAACSTTINVFDHIVRWEISIVTILVCFQPKFIQ